MSLSKLKDLQGNDFYFNPSEVTCVQMSLIQNKPVTVMFFKNGQNVASVQSILEVISEIEGTINAAK